MQRPPLVRCGYWNRRGDHLMPEGYIVYAPLDKAYPTELVAYPSEEEGYRNHEGVWCPWAERPELLESLPRRGRAPEKPYDGFVVYVHGSQMESLAQYESTNSSTDSLPSSLLSEHISKQHTHDNVISTAPSSLNPNSMYLQNQHTRFVGDPSSTQGSMLGQIGPTRTTGNRPAGVRRCSSCKTTSSHVWREGPSGKKDLCDGCGLRYTRSRTKKKRSNQAQQRRNKEKTSYMTCESVEPFEFPVGIEQKQKDGDDSQSKSMPSHINPWDLDARLAEISSRQPKTPTSSSSSYGSPQSARSRASSWSGSPGGHIPGTTRDVMEFPFGYPSLD